MEHFKTNHGKPGILYEGKRQGLKNGKFMEMREKSCKTRCKTDLEYTMILGGRFDHYHAEEEDRTIERQALRQTYKQKAVAEPCERPNKLITRSVNRGNSASTL